VNAEGRLQSFYAVVKPKGEARPAWKVIRALANVLNLPGFDFESSQEVLSRMHAGNDGGVPEFAPANRLSNACGVPSFTQASQVEPCVAGIYQLDGIVRRAAALQLTADATANGSMEVAA
jgi:NADH-quinone oxidoreductase subunit G